MTTNRERTLILCADDYGLAEGVGKGIRALIALGRLSATSCMTLFSRWPEDAARLKRLAGRADIGLHFTLTDHPPLGPMPRLAPDGRLPPLKILMGRAYTGTLDSTEVAEELARQITAFTEAMGRPPTFIDGHQHIHQLPVVRDAVIGALLALPGTYVRLCREPHLSVLRRGTAVPKTLLISELGKALASKVRALGLPANDGFRGVYGFSGRVPFATLMSRFLDPPVDRALVMVHPGRVDDELRRLDPLVDQREVEFAFLAGEHFGVMLKEKGIRLGRFSECLGGATG